MRGLLPPPPALLFSLVRALSPWLQVMKELVDASSLKREVVEGVDIMVVRELTGDVYFGTPKVFVHCFSIHPPLLLHFWCRLLLKT